MTQIEGLKLDYAINDEDDDIIRDIKKYIFSLNEAEQRIVLLYIETGSYSEVARQFNCSAPTVSKYVKPIINNIREYIENKYD